MHTVGVCHLAKVTRRHRNSEQINLLWKSGIHFPLFLNSKYGILTGHGSYLPWLHPETCLHCRHLYSCSLDFHVQTLDSMHPKFCQESLGLRTTVLKLFAETPDMADRFPEKGSLWISHEASLLCGVFGHEKGRSECWVDSHAHQIWLTQQYPLLIITGHHFFSQHVSKVVETRKSQFLRRCYYLGTYVVNIITQRSRAYSRCGKKDR